MLSNEHRRRRKQVSARVDPVVLSVFEHVAEAERRPVSNLVRNIIDDWARDNCHRVGAGQAAGE